MSKVINAIITGMPLDEEYVKLASKCITEFRPLVDKITFIQNGDFGYEYPKEVLDLVDIYIKNKKNRLHGGAINQGVLIAQDYEYLAILNDDIYPRELTREGMEDMCVEGQMTSPTLIMQGAKQGQTYGAHASFWIVDKPTFMKVGLWNLSLGQTADMDYFNRAERLGIPMKEYSGYTVTHDHPGRTINSGKFETPKFTDKEI